MRRQRLHQLLPEPEERALMQARRAVTPEPIVVQHSLSESMKAGPCPSVTSYEGRANEIFVVVVVIIMVLLSSSFVAYSAGALLCPQCAASRHE